MADLTHAIFTIPSIKEIESSLSERSKEIIPDLVVFAALEVDWYDVLDAIDDNHLNCRCHEDTCAACAAEDTIVTDCHHAYEHIRLSLRDNLSEDFIEEVIGANAFFGHFVLDRHSLVLTT